MKQDYDSSASGYIEDSFEGISRQFTDVEILTTSEVNIVARAKRYGRWWLLKGLNKNVADGVAYQQRLRKELELLMLLQHPNVVATNELEEVDGLGNCIVMEYVEGLTLKEWLKNNYFYTPIVTLLNELVEIIISFNSVIHTSERFAYLRIFFVCKYTSISHSTQIYPSVFIHPPINFTPVFTLEPISNSIGISFRSLRDLVSKPS